MSFDRIELLVFFTKFSFILFMVRWFFLLIHFLIVGDFEWSKTASHILTVPLTLECVRTLSWSISVFFYFNCFSDDVLCKFCVLLSELMILLSTHHVACHLICRNKLRWYMSGNVILKESKCITRNIRKCNSTSNYIYFYKLIHVDLKPRILIASFLLASLLNN